VAGLLAAASSSAGGALRHGEERRRQARASAEEAVSEARAAEAHVVALLAATAVPRGQRVHLQRARLLVREAEALLRGEEIEAARDRADLARGELGEALGPALEAAERYTSREQLATWRRWVEETRAFSRSTGQPAIVVLKEKNRPYSRKACRCATTTRRWGRTRSGKQRRRLRDFEAGTGS
jgi:hypothetical protein